MATAPAFAATPSIQAATISTANTNRDGATGTYTSVFAAGSSGSRIERVTVTANATTVAGSFVLWINNGTTNYLYKELAVTAVTASSTAAGFTASANLGLVVPSGYTLKATATTLGASQSFYCMAEGANF